MQDEIARVVLALARDDSNIYRFTPEEAAEQDAADAEEARGEYATDEDVRAIWTKHGPVKLRFTRHRRTPARQSTR